jgi:hypothetical protein
MYWSEIDAPLNGHSEIITYNLQWLHDGNWQDLQGELPGSIMTAFILTSDIERGVTYYFKVRAKNIHGWGEWSDQTQIKAAGPPYQSPSCQSENLLDGTILLSWFDPDNNSEDLTSQEIEI